MATDLLRERLPPGWQFGVTEDGRIFFIDEYRQETSWLHPVTGLPVESGMHPHPDLPPGWEQDSTPDGLTYYVDHNQRVTTFEHPFYGVNPPPPFEHIHNEAPNEQQHQQQQQQQHHQLAHGPSQPGLHVELQGLSPQPSQSPTTPGSPTSPGGKENFKRGAPKQRSVKAPSAKRNPQAVVIKKGWLHRLENTGISKSKAWKRRWCVLADFALFIYKGEDEQTTLDSILLPSYRINPSTEADNIKRNFVFKVEHENTKTLYLAAEDSPDSVSWMSNLRQAAMMDGNIGSFQREQNNNFRQHQKSGTAGGGGMRSNNSPEHQGDTGSQNTDKYGPGGRDTGNRSQYSPSYQGYGDPASSPPYSQQQQHYGPQQQQQQQLQPQHQQQYGPQQQQQPYPAHRQSYTSSDDGGFNPYSSSRGFDRNSQASYKQDESFRGQNSGRMEDRPDARDPRKFSNPIYQQFPSPSTSSGSTRPQLQQHQQRPPNQQQQLRDGFAPDSESARNSLAQSDSSGHRFYQPAQAERQRLQQQLGGMATSPHSHPQQSPNPESVYSVGRHHRAMDSFQRDSYSGESSTDGPHHHHPYKNSHSPSHQVVVKQLRPWDTSFPDLEVVTAKQHGSFDDLLDPGNRVGRQSARGPGGPSSKPTFNARSKSHENFSRLPPEHGPPGMQQPPHNAAQHQHQQQHQQHPHNNHGPNTRDDQPPSFRNSTRYQPERGSPGDSRNYPGNQGYMGHPHHPQQHLQQQQQQQHQQQPHHSPAGSLSSSQVSPQERQHQRDGHLPPSSRNPPQGFRNSYASSTNVVKPFNPNTSNQQQPSPYPGSDDRNASFRGSFHNNSNQSFQQTRPLSLASSAQVPSPSSSSQNNPHHHHDRGASDIVNPHTYVNFPNRGPGSNAVRAGYEGPTPRDEPPRNSSSYLAPPGRPPYPVAVRRQIVEEMAQVQTPVTQNDFLTSAELNQQRMQQPSFFQYPSPRDQYGNETNHHNMSQASMHSGAGRNLPNSRLSSASRVSTASRRGDGNRSSDLPDSSSSRRGGSGRDGQGQSSPHETSFSRTNMMDPEAQKLRMAYERVHSLRMAPDKAPPKRKPAPIQTVKEDPNMSDREVLETNLQKITKKNPLAGPRLRMSISAGDLIGKTHDELVLLLIQLRRNQAALEKARDYYRTLIDRCRPDELEYKRQMHQFGNVQDHQLLLKHQNYVDARGQTEEVENKLEVYKPIINLLDNMVTMGSLYGGDNLMLATQYRKHLLRPDQYQPPKKMLEFSRQHQEHRLQLETEQEIQQLSSDEVDLEEKIDRLNELDRLLQEQSFKVSSFREDKELLEKALVGVLRQQDQSYHGDPREMTRLTNQQRMLEQEISRVTQQLAEASKELEETSAENSKLEHEVALLRTKVHGELSRSRSAPSLSSENVRTKQQMEKELAKVEGIMAGLNQRGQKLQQAMSTIRRSSSSSHLAAANLDKLDNAEGSSPTSPRGTYLQTDLDSGEQLDLAQASLSVTNGAVSHDSYPNAGDSGSYAVSEETSPRPVINHQRQNAGSLEDWDMEGVDENTKRFFGLMPRDKPKGQTLREVKRLSEQRKEREKGRRDGDDSLDGQEIKLRVSNVDTEVSSIIHACIPSDKLVPNGNSSNSNGQFESGLPLYENLPGRNKTNPDTGSSTNGINHYPTTARRSSLILMAPKPFTPYQDRSSARPFKSELALNVAGSDTQDSGMQFPSVWRPSNSVAPSNDRPYHSVDFLNTPHESRSNIPVSSQPGFNSNVHHKRGDSNLYPSDTNNNNNDSSIFNKNERAYENDYIPQGQNYESSYQYQPTEISQQIIPNESADHITRPVDPNNIQTSTSRAYAARPWATKGAQFSDNNIFNSRRNSRGRYMTISSSEPIKLEINPTLHSSAGDLILNRSIDNVPDIVKSSQTIVDQIDEGTIDREILYVPDKVLIPERYDAEADAEQLTEEESLARKERAERIRKVLTSQSVLSMSQPDVSQLPAEEVHSRVRQEKREREHFLALNQELARQVTLKSKKQAAERRKTWSGAQFADAKAQYEADMAGSPGSSQLRSPDSERKRAEITLHDL